MKSPLQIAVLFLLITVAFPCAAQTADGQYLKLLRATQFVETYHRMAEVSARVFAARAQGTDLQFAQVMNKVAKANLSSSDSCIINVYKLQTFTPQDLDELTAFFVGPLGMKVLRASQQSQLESIEKLSVQPLPVEVLSEQEKRQLALIYQTPSFQKYAAFSSNRIAATAMVRCIMEAAGVHADH